MREEQARDPFGSFWHTFRLRQGPKDNHALEWRLSNDRPSGRLLRLAEALGYATIGASTP